jgi:CRP-like cAMP-binding protein
MYIILDGKVRVFARGKQGRPIPLAVLSENQFFGEISLLIGAPQTATVQAVEQTLLCKLNLETMAELFLRFPLVKTRLESTRRDRLKEAKDKIEKEGLPKPQRKSNPRISK